MKSRAFSRFRQSARIEMANIRNIESFAACRGLNLSPQFHGRRVPGMPLENARLLFFDPLRLPPGASLLNGSTIKKGCSDRGHIDQSRPAAICRFFLRIIPSPQIARLFSNTRAIENKSARDWAAIYAEVAPRRE